MSMRDLTSQTSRNKQAWLLMVVVVAAVRNRASSSDHWGVAVGCFTLACLHKMICSRSSERSLALYALRVLLFAVTYRG